MEDELCELHFRQYANPKLQTHIISYHIKFTHNTTLMQTTYIAIKVSACEGTDRYSTYTLKSIPKKIKIKNKNE